MKNFVILTNFIFVFFNAHAQLEFSKWYFGNKAGLDFSSGSAKVLSDSKINGLDNTCSIADSAGNLLFYFDGLSVYNKNHQVMSNGTNLGNDASSGHVAVAIRRPGTGKIYYIFTVEGYAKSNGLCYSIVDMSLNSGLGNVTSKKNNLRSPTTEKIILAKHSNQSDIWLITHKWNSNEWEVFPITDKGIGSPVSTAIGSTLDNSTTENSMGNMDVTLKYDRIAHALYNQGKLEIFDFNSSTGKLSNVISLSNLFRAWGVQFSPNGYKLYLTQWTTDKLWQYDLTSYSKTDIENSIKSIGPCTGPDAGYKAGYLMLAPDKKIYIAKYLSNYLGVINDPDASGSSCNFVDDGLKISPGISSVGLPNKTFDVRKCSIPKPYLGRDTAICKGQRVVLKDTVKNVSSYLWSNKATGSSISVWDTGTYWVEISNGSCKQRDTIHIAFKTTPVADLGKDTSLCEGQPKTLTCKQTGLKYVWSTSESTQSITVTKPGKYWVEVDLNGCKDSDTLPISFHNMPKPKLGKDTLLCEGTPLRLKGLTSNATSYQWNTGNNLPDQDVNTAGNYVVTVNDNLCTLSDTIRVDFIPLPKIDLGRDTAFCGDYSLTLDAGNPAMNKIWYNSLTNQSVVINNHFGWVWVEVSNQGCKKRDSLFIKKLAGPTLNLGRDTIYCHPISRWLDAQNPGMNYVWMDGSQNQTLLATSPGKYWVQLRDKAACLFSDTILLADSSFQFKLVADTTLCFGARLMLIGKGPGYTHSWSIGSSSTDLLVEKAGIYSVVISRGPCVKKDSILISYRKQLDVALRPDTGLCDDLGESLLLKAQTGFKSYHWSPGNETTEQIVVIKPGVYSVKVSDSYDCEAMASVNVLKICPMNAWVPTAFSPGTSGPNSRFGIVYQGPAAEGFEMLIFNRWGELIYKSTDILGSWDGNYLNQPCQLGMYMCIIRFSALYGNEKKRYVYEGMFYLNK